MTGDTVTSEPNQDKFHQFLTFKAVSINIEKDWGCNSILCVSSQLYRSVEHIDVGDKMCGIQV